MYNNRRYSLDRYSVNPEIKTVDISETFSETMGAVAGAAVPVVFQGGFAEVLRGTVRGTISIISLFGGAEILRSTVRPSANFPAEADFSSTFGGVVKLWANVETGVDLYSEIHAAACASKDIPVLEVLTENMAASARMLANVVVDAQMSAALLTKINAVANEVVQCSFSCDMRAVDYGSKNTPVELSSEDAFICWSWASKDIPWTMVLAELLTARTAGSKNIPAILNVSEVLTSILEAISQTTERTTLQLTIPPGGELRIDSELFRVLLNGENALHTQSGDWINVSRDLLRLTVESASGGRLQGQLIYTERYL